MKTNNLIMFTILAVFFVSCESELKIDPKQEEDATITLSTEKGITDILSGTYAILANGDAYGGAISISADLLAQTGVTETTDFRWLGTFPEYRDMYTKALLVDNGRVERIWARNYEAINATNVVIENIGLVQDPDKAKTMIAEAKFIQALAYFDLVRFFAKPYDFAIGTNNQLGVVIRPKAIYDFSVDLSAERSTVEEVYNLVISNLDDAYADLPADNGFYANKYAAKALLARVYLQQQNYVAALSAADEVIQDSGAGLSPTYAQAFNHDANQIEDIFAIQVTKQTGTNTLVDHYASGNNGGRGGDIEIRDTYLNKFTDPNDERRNFNYMGNNGERLTSKYTNQFGDVPVIRLAEMYLIRAECNFRLSSTTGATPLDDINALRTRAKATNFDSVTLSDILEERVLELAMEGFAIHDIKRTKGFIEGVYAWDSDLLVFPIPLIETDYNKKITQNPGY